MAQDITVIGTGYVGLVSAVGLADFGNRVSGVDIDPQKIDKLRGGDPVIYELGIEDYLSRNLQSGRLTFSTEIRKCISRSDIVFLAVGTPESEDGSADMRFIRRAIDDIAESMEGFTVVVTKSTVPVGTNRWIGEQLRVKAPTREFAVVSNPEFLREGKAVQDFFHPDRLVIGYDTERPEGEKARRLMEDVYRALYLIETPIVWCNLETAELIKYASNAFLATKITFINQMANLAEACGADIHAIAKTMGMDGRISSKFLHPGPGYGGSCFPKDTKAIVSTGDQFNVEMSVIREVIRANEEQKLRVAQKIHDLLGGVSGKTVAVLGLTFKAETDDIRESPAISVVERLLEGGARVRVHDPKGMDNFQALFGDRITYHGDEFEALEGGDCLVVLTEWNEFRNLDLEKAKSLMHNPAILDARNSLDRDRARELGFTYVGIGR
ncbi:MAG: UDP-glucose dehydrogenase family protein [Spirochaetia bacterium]